MKDGFGSSGFTHEKQGGGSVEYYTPPVVFGWLGNPMFDYDVASPGAKIVPWIPAKRHLTKKENGLVCEWKGKVWLNPPYGKGMGAWLQRLQEHGNGIALVFARPDTDWWHEYVIHADVLAFPRGRIHFVQAGEAMQVKYDLCGQPVTKNGTGCGSCLIAYGEECADLLLRAQVSWKVDLRLTGTAYSVRRVAGVA